MARTKVLYLVTGLYVGGAEKLVLTMARHLDPERFEPVVVALVGGDLFDAFEAAGIRTHDLGMRGPWDVAAFGRLCRLLRQERPQILHTHLFHADQLGRLAGRWCRVPVIVSTLHMLEAERHRWWCNPVSRWTSKLNTSLVAISEGVRQSFLSEQRLDPTKMRVIHNAVEAPPSVSDLERRQRRAEAGVMAGGQLVGVVSRLEQPRKGLDVLIRAMHRLAPAWPGLRCVLIGEGQGRPELERLIRSLGLEGRVRLMGLRHDVAAWLAAMDVFVLPSRDEGLPMAIIEAMGAGCPVVATPVGGVPELIIEGATGRLVPPGDDHALAQVLDDVLRDQAGARRLAEAGREAFQRQFDISSVIHETEALYEELLGLRPKRLKLMEIATSFDVGGVTTYLAGLIRSLPADEFDACLVSGTEQFQTRLAAELGVPHYPAALTKPVHPIKDVLALWQLYRLMRKLRVDIVHLHMSKADVIGGLAARLAGVPCVVSTAHGVLKLGRVPSFVQQFFELIERVMFRTFHHRIISVSEATTQELLAKRKVRPDQLITITNGIDEEPVRRGWDRDGVRRALGLSPSQPVVGMVGRLKAPKAPEILVESIGRLRARWPSLTCLIVGDGPDQPRLERLVHSMGLTGAVRLLGHREDVHQLLSAMDLFVLSSYSEGMSISVLEAMATGLAVVGSHVGGMPQLVEHGRTGLLVPAGDPVALAEAIDRLLADPGRRNAMGQAAYTRVLADFSLGRQARLTIDALAASYEECVRPAAAREPSALVRLARHAAEEGIPATFRRLWEHAIKPWYGEAHYWLLARSTERPAAASPKQPCTIRLATLQDLDRLMRVGFYSRGTLATLLNSPTDACFIAEQDGAILGFQWVAIGERDLDVAPLPWRFRLSSAEAYLYNSRALRPYRGQGIVPAIAAEALRWLAGRGIRQVYVLVRQANAPSLAMFRKLGFADVDRVDIWRWGRRVRIVSRQPRARVEQPLRLLLLERETTRFCERLTQGFQAEGLAACRAGLVVRPDGMPSAGHEILLPAWKSPMAWLRSVRRVRRLVRDLDIELVHAHGVRGLLLAWAALGRSRVHITCSLPETQQPVRGLAGRWLMRRAFARAQHLWFASETDGLAWSRARMLVPSRVDVWPQDDSASCLPAPNGDQAWATQPIEPPSPRRTTTTAAATGVLAATTPRAAISAALAGPAEAPASVMDTWQDIIRNDLWNSSTERWRATNGRASF